MHSEKLARPDVALTPQLSERDSIFATHYLPSDSGGNNTPQLLPEKAAVKNEHQINLIPGLDDAAVSPSPLPKVSFHRCYVDPSHMEVDVHRHSPIRSPQFPPPDVRRRSLLRSSISSADQVKDQAVGGSSHSPARGGPESLPNVSLGETDTKTDSSQDAQAERIQLPSTLDDASHPRRPLTPPSSGHDRPMFSDRNTASVPPQGDDSRGPAAPERSPSRGRRRVDSTIEANLTNTELASNVRSRKSSHYLGLFKENTTSPDRKKWDDRGQQRDEPAELKGHAMDQDKEPMLPPPDEDAFLRKSTSLPALGDDPSLEQPSPPPKSLKREEQEEPEKQDQHDSRALPRNLLEEIRNFHLTPGGVRGSSFSKSIPRQYTERRRDYHEKTTPEHLKSPPSTPEQERHVQSGKFEDEDEENEQISSAVYFPHERVAVPREVEDLQSLAEEKHIVQPVQLTPAEKGHELMLVPQERSPSPEQGVSHVDISFRSKNESKILHGDIQDFPSPLESVTEQPLGAISERSYDSTCESDVVSADESGPSALDESSLTDDAEVTPTATPIQRPRLLARRKPPSGPLGVVELKPYRHQVGGHTTVFRFSRRAVCKQLNNRENEFYERIERRHPDMLMFLPRYVSCWNFYSETACP